MCEKENHRIKITEQKCCEAMAEARYHLFMRIRQKGTGAFVSRHEILGVITDEYSELIAAVQQKRPLDDVSHELRDIAVACFFADACIQSGALDW